jgi:hypothetical protein
LPTFPDATIPHRTFGEEMVFSCLELLPEQFRCQIQVFTQLRLTVDQVMQRLQNSI